MAPGVEVYMLGSERSGRGEKVLIPPPWFYRVKTRMYTGTPNLRDWARPRRDNHVVIAATRL